MKIMPIKNNSHLVIFDFETTGLDTTKCQPYEIAAKIYNERSLEPIPNAEFVMLCRPSKDCTIEEESLKITGVKREDIEKASPIEIVYPKFIEWLLKYNPEQSKWTAPIACGHNINRFDILIHRNMMLKFGKKYKYSFNEMHTIDLMDLARLFFSNTNEITAYNLNALRQFFGIPTEGAHRALKDVEDAGWMITKLLRFQRKIVDTHLNKMKNAYSKDKVAQSCLS